MMDLKEATKTLNAYSTSIESKARFYDRTFSDERPEAKQVIIKILAALKVETKDTMIVLTLVLEEIIKRPTQFVVDFTEELTELMEAINRNQAATAEARKLTHCHEVQSGRDKPKESPSAKMIREFLEKRGNP